MENNYGMLMILLFPILGGIAGFYLGKKQQETRNDWIDIVMFVELVMQFYLGYILFAKGMEASFVLNNLLGLGLSLTMDVVRLVLCIMTTIIFGIITQFMKESMRQEAGSNRFYLLYMCMYSMVLGAFMANNLFNFFMFGIFALLFGYPLIMHRQDMQAIKGARVYFSFLIAQMVLILSGIVMVYAHLGSVSYSGMYSSIMSKGGNAVILTGGLFMFAGFAIFAGVFPVQFQVTKGCSYGLMEISAVLSGVVSKIGIFGILILASDLFVGSMLYGRILFGLGMLTAIWGLIITLLATDIRKILMGMDVAVNGFNIIGIALMVLCGDSNGFAMRSSFYFLLVSALSMMTLYMVALEQVRKINTYEIKGLIASGKGHTLLAVVCFIACISLGGVPGTAGFLAHSMLYQTIFINVGWKWLTVIYIVLWAFWMTAVTRIFMKFFVSKKEETIHILATEEELQDNAEEPDDEKSQEKNPYAFAEVLLLLTGVLQVAIGVAPNLFVEKLAADIADFFHGENITDAVSYFAGDALIGFAIAVVLCIILYLNLVHGILLRAIRDNKNKKLQKGA